MSVLPHERRVKTIGTRTGLVGEVKKQQHSSVSTPKSSTERPTSLSNQYEQTESLFSFAQIKCLGRELWFLFDNHFELRNKDR
jgi:hypothetical protein